MERKLKLIWDFKGPNALETAKHHTIHLQEFAEIENLQSKKTGVVTLNELHSYAFLVVTNNQMKIVRDALKPHRGQVHED